MPLDSLQNLELHPIGRFSTLAGERERSLRGENRGKFQREGLSFVEGGKTTTPSSRRRSLARSASHRSRVRRGSNPGATRFRRSTQCETRSGSGSDAASRSSGKRTMGNGSTRPNSMQQAPGSADETETRWCPAGLSSGTALEAPVPQLELSESLDRSRSGVWVETPEPVPIAPGDWATSMHSASHAGGESLWGDAKGFPYLVECSMFLAVCFR